MTYFSKRIHNIFHGISQHISQNFTSHPPTFHINCTLFAQHISHNFTLIAQHISQHI